jgi:hypothetical protein
MPKIEVYKGNRVMIPVSEAKKAKAYQCPWTDKIYSTKRDYVKHLKLLRETRMHTRARAIIKDRVKQDLWSQSSFDDIIKWVSIHPEFMFDLFMNQAWHHDKAKLEKYRNTFMVEITNLDVTWSERCSNTHRKPHNGVTNWGGKEKLKDGTDAPSGYAGWTGNIEFKLNCPMSEGSNVFSHLRMNTGSGGGRSDNRYGYDVTFFANDWPELYKLHKHRMAEDAILNNKTTKYTYRYGKPDYFKW